MAGRMKNLSSWLCDATSQNICVILVHDDSKDSTRIELQQLVKDLNSPNIRLLEVAVQSPGKARNAGLDAVRTAWFCFADSDDFVSVEHLRSLLQETKASGSDIGIGAYEARNLFSGQSCIVVPQAGTAHEIALDLARKMGLWRFIFANQTYGDLRFSRHRMGEDYLFINQVLDRSSKIYLTSTVVYKYYFGGKSNLTSNKAVMRDMLAVMKEMSALDITSPQARIFRNYAQQKLAISFLKNAPGDEVRKNFLIVASRIILHPLYFCKLIWNLKARGIGRR